MMCFICTLTGFMKSNFKNYIFISMVFSGHIKNFIAINLILYSFASAAEDGATCKLSFPSESFGSNHNEWNYNNINSWKSNTSLILIRIT